MRPVDVERLTAARLQAPDAPDHDDVVAALEYLAALGVGEDLLDRAIEEGWLPSAGIELLLGATAGGITADDVAAHSGLTSAEVLEVYRLLGIRLPGPDVPLLLPEETSVFDALLVDGDTFEEGEGDEILRMTGQALTGIAESIVSVFVGGVEDRIEHVQRMSLRERTELTQATGEQAMGFGRALAPLFRHHLRQAIVRQRASMGRAQDRRLRTMTLGFVDLVGFTPLSALMSPGELVAFIRDFEARSWDVASRAGGRIVKVIGDEVMISALDVETGCEIVVGLIEEFATSEAQPRAGLATGEVVSRLGDFFGPVVNLASRLVDQAVPGEVLAEAARTGQHHGARFRCEPAGRRMLKGFADPVEVVTILRR